MAKCTRFILSCVSVMLLVACAPKPNNIFIYPLEVQRRAYIKAVQKDLNKAGAELVLVGETVRIIFPSDEVFNFCSANLSPNYLPVLDETARMMRKLESVSVKISGYTNCKHSYVLNKALSKRQAEMLAEYLFDRRLDARLVPTYGYGNQNAIMMNENDPRNRRMEINFQYLPLLKQ